MLTMSKTLADLLGAYEPLFSLAIQELEKGGGQPNADISLTSEISTKAHQKIKELALDPKDTTGKELYYSLLNLTKLHDSFLVQRIGGTDPGDVKDLLPKIKETVERLNIPKSAWVLKHSVAKRLIKASPPRKVMKQLGYRSIDSMLKREPIAELYGAIRFIESPQWLDNFLLKYKKLQPSDFEVRDIELVHLSTSRWEDTANNLVQAKKHNITHLKELGVILILPLPIIYMPGITITTMPLLLHYINEIRLYSSYFKLQQVRPNFGEILSDTLINDPKHHALIGGQQIHWRVIQRYFGSIKSGKHPEMFEPHVQAEDLYWRKAEDILYRLEPALHFWYDMDYVGVMYDSKPVSFNLIDLALSYVNNLSYDQHSKYHFRDSLWNELYSRYLGARSLESQVLSQLEDEMTEPKSLAMIARRST